MPTMTTFDQVGTKRSIAETISNISPANTPFQTLIGSMNIKNTKHEWQTMALAAVATANAAIQGAAAPAAGFTATAMLDNLTQILTGTVGVTGTLDAVDAHGRASELALQLANKSKELKRDLEAIMLLDQARVVGNASTASKMDSAQKLIHASHKFHAADGTTTLNAGAPAAFNETCLMAANEVLYTSGGEATILLVKPKDARLIAGFAAATGRLRDMEDSKEIVNVVDVYVSPFGRQKVVIDRWIKATDSLLFSPDMWKKLVLRNWFRQTLAVTGDATNVQILGEFSLKHENDKASALITDLS